jgi:hypothetical protein
MTLTHEPPSTDARLAVVGRVPLPARRLSVGSYLETLLIVAVVTILVVRGSLAAAGYPQVGGGGLHIAHMLWGGLLMLVAAIVMLAFIGDGSRWLGAVGAGIGFGLFIDELGKFITSNHDYFFEPTVGLLYLLFVLLFLVFRLLDRPEAKSAAERLANIGDALPDVLMRGSAGQYQRARRLADHRSLGDDPVALAVRQILTAVRPDDRGDGRPGSLRHAQDAYERVLGSTWFQRGVAIVFILNALVGVLVVLVALAVAGVVVASGALATALAELEAEPDFQGWLPILLAALASFAVLVLTLIGLVRLRHSRLEGFLWLNRSVVVSLLLVQPFAFFSDQFGALGGLAFNLVLWLGTGYVVHSERVRRAAGA